MFPLSRFFCSNTGSDVRGPHTSLIRVSREELFLLLLLTMTEGTSILLNDLSSKHGGQLSIVFTLSKISQLILQKSLRSNDDEPDSSPLKGNTQVTSHTKGAKNSGTIELYTVVRESRVDENILWSMEILPTTGETPEECKHRLVGMFNSVKGASPILRRLQC